MSQIHRKAVDVGVSFTAPKTITFGFQESRQGYSVWYNSADPETETYIILGTGHEIPGDYELVDSNIVRGEHFVFHLLRKK